jgi:hypothetical protein
VIPEILLAEGESLWCTDVEYGRFNFEDIARSLTYERLQQILLQ